jgi:hypothetical protein
MRWINFFLTAAAPAGPTHDRDAAFCRRNGASAARRKIEGRPALWPPQGGKGYFPSHRRRATPLLPLRNGLAKNT